MQFIVACLVLACSSIASAQKLNVRVIGRQDNQTDYSYVVPGYFNATSSFNTNANCTALTNGSFTNANCNGHALTTTSGTLMPAQEVSFQVQGATLTLQLPDGRAAVVNCKSKFQERFAGIRGNHRDCRVPLVQDIEADFHGDSAKLDWIVSLDGKKTQAETYKVIAILDKPKVDTSKQTQ